MGVTTPFPSPDAIARADLRTREGFVYDGETLEEALATGSPRRRALDAAVAEVEAGRKTPSIEWRRQYSLLLGLERLLSEEEPHLVDGTVLSAHQVDALSGTLTALLAESQRTNGGNGNGAAAGTANGNGDANGRGHSEAAAAAVRAATAEPDTRPAPGRNGTATEDAEDVDDDLDGDDEDLDDVDEEEDE